MLTRSLYAADASRSSGLADPAPDAGAASDGAAQPSGATSSADFKDLGKAAAPRQTSGPLVGALQPPDATLASQLIKTPGPNAPQAPAAPARARDNAFSEVESVLADYAEQHFTYGDIVTMGAVSPLWQEKFPQPFTRARMVELLSRTLQDARFPRETVRAVTDLIAIPGPDTASLLARLSLQAAPETLEVSEGMPFDPLSMVRTPVPLDAFADDDCVVQQERVQYKDARLLACAALIERYRDDVAEPEERFLRGLFVEIAAKAADDAIARKGIDALSRFVRPDLGYDLRQIHLTLEQNTPGRLQALCKELSEYLFRFPDEEGAPGRALLRDLSVGLLAERRTGAADAARGQHSATQRIQPPRGLCTHDLQVLETNYAELLPFNYDDADNRAVLTEILASPVGDPQAGEHPADRERGDAVFRALADFASFADPQGIQDAYATAEQVLQHSPAAAYITSAMRYLRKRPTQEAAGLALTLLQRLNAPFLPVSFRPGAPAWINEAFACLHNPKDEPLEEDDAILMDVRHMLRHCEHSAIGKQAIWFLGQYGTCGDLQQLCEVAKSHPDMRQRWFAIRALGPFIKRFGHDNSAWAPRLPEFFLQIIKVSPAPLRPYAVLLLTLLPHGAPSLSSDDFHALAADPSWDVKSREIVIMLWTVAAGKPQGTTGRQALKQFLAVLESTRPGPAILAVCRTDVEALLERHRLHTADPFRSTEPPF